MGDDFNLLPPNQYRTLATKQQRYYRPNSELSDLAGLFSSIPSMTDIETKASNWFSFYSNAPDISKPDRTLDYLFYSPLLQCKAKQFDNTIRPTFRIIFLLLRASTHRHIMNSSAIYIQEPLMSVDVILDLQVNPENREELLAIFKGILPDTRAYQGCQGVVVTTNEDDLHNIVLLEKWAHRSDHESYMDWRVERGDIDKLVALLSAPPAVRYLESISI
jgi:quinol monooxygenase YgiN